MAAEAQPRSHTERQLTEKRRLYELSLLPEKRSRLDKFVHKKICDMEVFFVEHNIEKLGNEFVELDDLFSQFLTLFIPPLIFLSLTCEVFIVTTSNFVTFPNFYLSLSWENKCLENMPQCCLGNHFLSVSKYFF